MANIRTTTIKKLLAIAAFAGLSAGAHADPIGPTCTNDSCFGGIYQLVYQQVSATNYLFGIYMDLSGNTLPAGVTIDAVGFKVTSSTSDIVSAMLVGTNAAGTWSQPIIGSFANDCTPGPAAFICSQHSGTPQLADTNTILSWVFDITVTNASEWELATASLKVDFGTGPGQLLSEPITAQPGTVTTDPQCIPIETCGEVPEPGTLALLALGLFGMGFALRRKDA